MTLPDHDLQADGAAASGSRAIPHAVGGQEHDLRLRGLLAVLGSSAGTCAALAAWMLYGIFLGAAVLVATFMLLVIFLMTGSARAARRTAVAQRESPELEH